MKTYKYLLLFVIIQLAVSLHFNNHQHKLNSYQFENAKENHNKPIHRDLVDLTSNFLYKNNLKNSNWYYGSINQTQYRVRLFVAGTKNNLTICPYDQPYTKQDNRTQCFNCPNDAPLFNLGNSQCERCPQGYYFLNSLGNCTQGSQQINTQLQSNPTTQVTSSSGLVATLKGESSNSQKNLTDNQSNKTIKKDKNGTKVTNTSQIQSNLTSTESNATQESNTTTKKSFIYNCPYETPLQLQDGSCVACNQTQQYFQIDNKCSEKIYRTNPLATKLILPSEDYLQNQTQTIKNNHPNRIIYDCPSEKPYLSGQICISCQTTQLFDAKAGSCIDGCSNYNIYDKKLKQCVQGHYLTNPKIGNLIFNVQNYESWKNNIEQQMQNTSFAQYCPDSIPYAVNGQCISCSDDKPYFNVDKQNCSGCEQGRSYDQAKRTCLTQYDASVSLGRSIMNIIG